MPKSTILVAPAGYLETLTPSAGRRPPVCELGGDHAWDAGRSGGSAEDEVEQGLGGQGAALLAQGLEGVWAEAGSGVRSAADAQLPAGAFPVADRR